jgi:quercetin dioxygenase-like cupin family protein
VPSQPDLQPVIVRPGDGASHRTPYGDVLAWIAGGDDTAGGFSLHERTAPPGSRSTPHAHHRFVEAFYVLEGELQFAVGNERLAAASGTFVLAPKGVQHAWHNATDRTARALVFFSPSAKRGYLEDMHAIVERPGVLDAAALQALNKTHGWD